MKSRKIILLMLIFALGILLTGCRDKSQKPMGQETSSSNQQNEEIAMKLYINDQFIDVMWDKNSAVSELCKQAQNGDITIEMRMYGGWEQVGSLGRGYPSSDTYITAECGDIVLYCGNQIVVFYGSNSWEYTHLGKMNLPDDAVQALLSSEAVTLKLSAK